MSNTLGCVAEEVSKQRVEGTTWFLLAAYSKMQKKRDKLREELFLDEKETRT